MIHSDEYPSIYDYYKDQRERFDEEYASTFAADLNAALTFKVITAFDVVEEFEDDHLMCYTVDITTDAGVIRAAFGWLNDQGVMTMLKAKLGHFEDLYQWLMEIRKEDDEQEQPTIDHTTMKVDEVTDLMTLPQLAQMLREIREMGAADAPSKVQMSDHMKTLFESKLCWGSAWLDQYNQVRRAIEFTILNRVSDNRF